MGHKSDFVMRKTTTVRNTIINSGSSKIDTVVMNAGVGFEFQQLTRLSLVIYDEICDIILKLPSESLKPTVNEAAAERSGATALSDYRNHTQITT